MSHISIQQTQISHGAGTVQITGSGNRVTGSAAPNQTRRTLDLLEALCGYAATGATNSDLARACHCTPYQVTRDMAQLIAKGWARKSEESERFFPTPAFTRLTFRVTADLDRIQQRLDDQRRALTGECP